MAASLTSTDLTLDNTSGASIPGTPSAGQTVLYPKDDKLLYYKNDAGQELPPGKVVQIKSTQTGAVASGTGVIPTDDTIPQITEGDQYLALAFTPTATSNMLCVEFNCQTATDTADRVIIGALFVGTTADALAVCHSYDGGIQNSINSLVHHVSAGVTTELIFRVRLGCNAAATTTLNGYGTVRRYGGKMSSSLTITEYTP